MREDLMERAWWRKDVFTFIIPHFPSSFFDTSFYLLLSICLSLFCLCLSLFCPFVFLICPFSFSSALCNVLNSHTSNDSLCFYVIFVSESVPIVSPSFCVYLFFCLSVFICSHFHMVPKCHAVHFMLSITRPCNSSSSSRSFNTYYLENRKKLYSSALNKYFENLLKIRIVVARYKTLKGSALEHNFRKLWNKK